MQQISKILLLLLVVSIKFSSAQNDTLKYRISINELNFQIEEVDGAIFENEISESTEKNVIQPSIKTEEEFTKEYPSIFKQKDGCYSFQQLNINPLLVCKKESPNNDRGFQGYSFKGKYCNSSLIYTTGYESWGYITVDLNNGLAFYTMGKPITHNCKYVLSHSNYYGEEEISLTNMSTKKQLLFIVDSSTTSGSKFIKGYYYLKMKKWNGEKHLISYLRIKTE